MSEIKSKSVEFNSTFDVAKNFFMSKKIIILCLIYIYTLDFYMADKGLGLSVFKDNIPTFISDNYDYIYHIAIFTIVFVFYFLLVQILIFALTHQSVYKDNVEYNIKSESKDKKNIKLLLNEISRVEDLLSSSIFYLTVIHLLLNYIIVDDMKTKFFHLAFIVIYPSLEYTALRNLLYVKGFLIENSVRQKVERMLVFIVFVVLFFVIVQLVFLNNIPA